MGRLSVGKKGFHFIPSRDFHVALESLEGTTSSSWKAPLSFGPPGQPFASSLSSWHSLSL